MKERELLRLTWDRVEMLVDLLAKQLKDVKITHLAAIPRGGYIPAVMLAHRLGIEGHIFSPEAFSNPFLNVVDGQTVLVVDDIVDSGRTLETIKGHNVRTAALIVNDHAKVRPHFEAIGSTGYYWYVFPWEVDPERDQRGYIHKCS